MAKFDQSKPRAVWILLMVIIIIPCMCRCDDSKNQDASSSNFEILMEAEHITSRVISLRSPMPETIEFQRERNRMVDYQIYRRGVRDPNVLNAMKRIPRHEYVPASEKKNAYDDQPLPIGHGQTISQPYIVAYMTEILKLNPGDKVLEVGTGSGYQAAVLGEIVSKVVTIEIIDELAGTAATRLKDHSYNQITVISGDGYFGWERDAPYDAIIVTAAADHVPPPLLKQLKPGGRMIIPVGKSGWTQNLLLIIKDLDGNVQSREVMAVRFVPLTRKKNE